jgi:hypothetical protein
VNSGREKLPPATFFMSIKRVKKVAKNRFQIPYSRFLSVG